MKIVTTKTVDGLLLNGLLSIPATRSKKLIIHVHGMAGTPLLNEYYQPMHDEYPKANVAFLAVELRGTGIISSLNSDDGVRVMGNAFEKFEDSVLDLDTWIEFSKKAGFQEIWLQAHSLGTSKVAYYVQTTNTKDIAGLLLLSPSDMIGLVHDKEGSKDHQIMFGEAKKLVMMQKGQCLIGHQLWNELYLSADTYLNFFDQDANTAVFNFGNDSLGWEVVHAIQLPVLAITGTNDDGIVPIMDPYKAMAKLKAELIKSPRIKTVVLEGADHSFDGFSDDIIREALDFIKH